MKLFLLFGSKEYCKFICHLTHLEITCDVFLLNHDPEKLDCGYSP